MIEETIFTDDFPRGEYQDILIGPQGEVVWQRPWRQNLIVAGMGRLLAAAVKGDKQGIALNYWAVGDGEGDMPWEQRKPTDADRRKMIKLYHETGRNPIFPGQIIYLDDHDQKLKLDTLKIVANFTVEDIAGTGDRTLREFGLFAGGEIDPITQKPKPNSGTLINHCIDQPEIKLEYGYTLLRTLHLIFWKEELNP